MFRHPISLAFTLSLYLGQTLAVLNPSPPVVQDDAVVTAPPSNDFSAAVAHAATLAVKYDLLTDVPARPTFTRLVDDNGKPDLQAIASATPSVQRSLPADWTVEGEIQRLLDPALPPPSIDLSSLAERASPLRVMVVGDSISQGRSGDFTWRYRLWSWFKSNNIDVDFVGPYPGTKAKSSYTGPPLPPPLYPASTPADPPTVNGTYAMEAANFDSNHFSLWGQAMAVDQGLIKECATNYTTDLMLLLLGFNDLGWHFSTDEYGVLNSTQSLIHNARSANPNMKFAVANIVQRTFLNGRQDLVDKTTNYNKLLPGRIASWTTAQSPIKLVKLQENYNCNPSACPDGYDGLHPNELGEYHIAQAFSQTLYNDFGLGRGPLSVPNPVPVRPLPVPSNFKVFSSPQGVTATWDDVYAAYGYDVNVTVTDGVNFSPSDVTVNRWDTKWAVEGTTYTVRVRATAGDTRKGDWTSSLSAVAHPQTATYPQNATVRGINNGLQLSWKPPSGPNTNTISEYNVYYFDTQGCSYLTTAAFKGTSAQITGLRNGHRHVTLIATWNANGEGFPLTLPDTIPGYGTPSAPQIRVDGIDQTSVQILANSVAGAAGYAIWNRNINNASDKSHRAWNPVNVNCANIVWLYPGIWNYDLHERIQWQRRISEGQLCCATVSNSFEDNASMSDSAWVV